MLTTLRDTKAQVTPVGEVALSIPSGQPGREHGIWTQLGKLETDVLNARRSMSSAQAALSSSKGGGYGFAEKGNSFASGDNASERKSIISYPPMYLVKESLTWVSNVESVGYTATLASLLTIEQFELASNGRKFNITADLVEEDKEVAKWVIRAGLSKWVRIGLGRTGHLWNGLKCGHGQQELDWDSYEKMEREIALQKVPKSANVAKAKEMAQIRAER
ncbi:hypothetical protein Tco_1113789 [Tanacetum coccineum]|uniref:Uncharacterized protein n=1 Tax=Tanacetum coccineum TaxID=301880 RepID=A0ABQ5ITQ1_9ASTR